MRFAAIILALWCAGLGAAEITVGSKKFTESVVLGEVMRLQIASLGVTVEHKDQLGGSRILFNALSDGRIHAYPEYTGTLALELLAEDTGGQQSDIRELKSLLAQRGLGLIGPLGFNNTYALGMQKAKADSLGLSTISDLAKTGGLEAGFSNEFMQRADGWPALSAAYGLDNVDATGLDHDLAYRALESGGIDVIDLYSTDAEIAYYDLAALADDRKFFPAYEAVILYRLELEQTHPEVVDSLREFTGAITAETMTRLNAAVKIDGQTESAVAAEFLGVEALAEAGMASRIANRTGEHLLLTAISLGAAVILAIPLGVVAARRRHLGQWILSATGLLQTVPSLAMFVFMIPLLGIGTWPAIAALFLYSLLPIVRNTHAGLVEIDKGIVESAQVMGLPKGLILRRIQLPLAAPMILAGIKTAAVINVGTATLGALIGAGGYGQPILTGIRLDDTALILEGAIPAALLALGVQLMFDWLEKRLGE